MNDPNDWATSRNPTLNPPHRWTVANNIVATDSSEPLLRDPRILYQMDDFKITLYRSPLTKFFLIVVDGVGNVHGRQASYFLQLPDDCTEYTFRLYGVICKLWHDENNELQTESWFSFIDEEIENRPYASKGVSDPARLPWRPDDADPSDLDDLLAKLDLVISEDKQ